MGALLVELGAELIEATLLTGKIGARRTSGLVLQGAMEAFVASVLRLEHSHVVIVRGDRFPACSRGRSRAGRRGSCDNSREGRFANAAPYYAALISPSCCSAVTPSSRPTSSAILPSLRRSTVVPVKCILRPVAAGSDPTRKSLNAGPVCVPPPSH